LAEHNGDLCNSLRGTATNGLCYIHTERTGSLVLHTNTYRTCPKKQKKCKRVKFVKVLNLGELGTQIEIQFVKVKLVFNNKEL